MLKTIYIFILCCIASYFSVFAQSKVTFEVPNHPDAEIWHNGVLVGRGNALIKIDKLSNTVVARKAGYKDYTLGSFNKDAIKELLKNSSNKVISMEFDTRLVELTTSPYDALIHIDGIAVGKQNYTLEVAKGKTVTLELKKTGFQTLRKEYSFGDNNLPPIKDNLKLETRIINIVTQPSDVSIYADDRLIGKGNGSIVIPVEGCVNIKTIKEGYLPQEQTFCNKASDVNQLPISLNIILRDRVLHINTTPAKSTIKIDGKVVATGEFDVKVRSGECVEVLIEHAGFEQEKKVFCNKDNITLSVINEHIELRPDEAYIASAQVDQANIDIAIDVKPTRSNDEAWKLLSMIVTSHFDVLEITDKETGYIRTSWVLKSFRNNTIRTRFIVKQSSISPLQYKVKIQTQQSRKPQTSVKDDHEFEDWDRVLNTYKDIINEMQSRLKN